MVEDGVAPPCPSVGSRRAGEQSTKIEKSGRVRQIVVSAQRDLVDASFNEMTHLQQARSQLFKHRSRQEASRPKKPARLEPSNASKGGLHRVRGRSGQETVKPSFHQSAVRRARPFRAHQHGDGGEILISSLLPTQARISTKETLVERDGLDASEIDG